MFSDYSILSATSTMSYESCVDDDDEGTLFPSNPGNPRKCVKNCHNIPMITITPAPETKKNQTTVVPSSFYSWWGDELAEKRKEL